MNEELNGQVCELCKMFVAKPEKYAGATWLCEVCTPRKKHQTVIVKGETINGTEYTSTRPCRCLECQPHLAPPPEGTVCCLDSCDKEATIFSSWGEPFCRECMLATDHAIDAAQGNKKLNISMGLNPDGSMTRYTDNAGNPRYGTDVDARMGK